MQRWKDIKHKGMSAERARRLDREVKGELIAMTLRELRARSGKTQAETAVLARMTQSELSRLERRDDHLLSTLRRYVRALGGELDVVVTFGDDSFKLRDV